MTPTLSVVIPVHNAADTLGEQLVAVVQSLTPDMELVIVDNRSTDGSRSIAERFAAEHAHVRVVDADERAGEPYARNVGVAAARSELIAFCDADDVVASGWVSAVCEALRDANFCTGPVDVTRLNPPWLAGVRGTAIFERLPLTVGDIPFAHGCNMGMRREVLERLGGFDESVRIGTDIDFAVRAHQAGVELSWVPNALVHYRHRLGARERWRQAVAYGRASHHLHSLLGEPWGFWVRARHQVRRFCWMLKTLPRLGDRRHRAQWMWTLALAIGEIAGAER